MADRSDGNGKRSMPAAPAQPEEKLPSPDRVEAVSARLSEKKILLDRPSMPVKLDWSEVSRSISDVLRPSKGAAPPASGSDTRSLSLDPSRIDVPVESPSRVEPRQGQQFASESAAASPSNPNAPAPSSASRAIPTATRPGIAPAPIELPAQPIGGIASGRATLSRSIGSTEGRSESSSRLVEAAVSGPSIAPSMALPVGSGGRTDHNWGGHLGASTGPGASVEPSSQPESSRVGGVPPTDGLGEPGVSSRIGSVAALGHPQDLGGLKPTSGSRDLDGVQVASSRTSPPGIMANSRSDSSRPAESSMSFVRNPLSSDLKNFSMAGPADSGPGSGSARSGAAGPEPDDPSTGGSGSPQGGNPVDLTKTNELLQQLLDAVRKQRGSALPAGGQSVYPDR